MADGSYKIKRETLSDKVEQTLRKMLVEGHWQDGERLPSEVELAGMFGVSRLTVRMALQKLSVQGLVDIRVGDGTFAKRFSIHSYLKKATDLYITPEMMEDVCEFRKSLEIECARLAVDRADERDIREMQKCVDRYTYVRSAFDLSDEENYRKHIEADLDFHYALCRSSHNSLLILAFNTTRGAITNYLSAIIAKRIRDNKDAFLTADGRDVHQLILDAIVEKDFPRCKDIYNAMIDYKFSNEEYGRIVSRHMAEQKERRYRAQA